MDPFPSCRSKLNLPAIKIELFPQFSVKEYLLVQPLCLSNPIKIQSRQINVICFHAFLLQNCLKGNVQNAAEQIDPRFSAFGTHTACLCNESPRTCRRVGEVLLDDSVEELILLPTP